MRSSGLYPTLHGQGPEAMQASNLRSSRLRESVLADSDDEQSCIGGAAGLFD